jgi:signal recognition particle receptor subunit beta
MADIRTDGGTHLGEVSSQISPILVAVLVVIVTVFSFVLLRIISSASVLGSSSRTAVLVGPCNGGKTCMFYQLMKTGIPEATVSSMQENMGTCQLQDAHQRPAGSMRIVDVPGHERLRHKLDQNLKDARAVIFVLDAVDITPHKVYMHCVLSDWILGVISTWWFDHLFLFTCFSKGYTAEELYEILTHPSISRRRVPILVACNKMDIEAEAHSVDFIRRTLEKQLDAMRKTRTALSEESKSAALGKLDKPLSLNNLRNTITFAPVSALKGDVASVYEFLRLALR